MNNKLKNLIIIFISLLFLIFLLNIFNKGNNSNKSVITNMDIVNYIPSDYDLSIISNSTSNNIKRYINENIPENKRNELNIIKDSIISYLGFDLQEKIENLYNNEFAITLFGYKSNKIDILLIFKLKENKDINHIINTGEEYNKSDQIIELKRLGKLNYITHISKTKDNYIIASSNKKLIYSSLQSNNNEKFLSKNLIPDDINLKGIKLLSISRFRNSKNALNSESTNVNELVTIINQEDNKIKLISFSPTIKKFNTKIFNNKIDNIKDIIFTNKYSTFEQNMNFLYNKINEKNFLEEIYKEVNEKLLFITNNDNWVLCFKNKLSKKSSIDQFNFLKKYKREDFFINNMNYSIYTNDRLKIKDNYIIYEKANPIFSLKDDVNTYISNNFEDLIDITKKTYLLDQYLNHDDNNLINPYNYILNDKIFINYINNQQLVKNFKSLKNLKYFINTELFSLEDININISQTIPERFEKLYLESNFKIL